MTPPIAARCLATLCLATLCLAAAAALPAGRGDATAATAPARACFFAGELSNWTEGGDGVVNLRVGVNDVYQLTLLGRCPDLRDAEAIGIETVGGSRHICSGLDVSLIVPSSVTHTVPLRCMGASLRKLSPEEARALPRGQRP